MNNDMAYIARMLGELFSGLRYTNWRPDVQTGKLDDTGALLSDVSVGLPAGYIWVRLGADRAAVPMLSRIRGAAGLPVIVAFDRLIGEDVVYEINLARAIPVLGSAAAAYNVPVIPVGVYTPVSARDVQPGSVRAADIGGLIARIMPTWVPDGGWYDGTVLITLTPTATSDNQSFVLVGVNSSGDAVTTLTADRELTYPLIDAEGALTTYGAEDIQTEMDADPNTFWCGAVLLANGATTIDGNRIYDTRMWRAAGSSSGGTLTSYQDQLGSDVGVANDVWSDVLSRSLSAGTWLISASACVVDGSYTAHFVARISDGSTHYASGQSTTSDPSYAEQISLTAIVTLVSTTTVKLQGTSPSVSSPATSKFKAATPNDGSGNNATTMTCVKIA